jgi:hypothetical protein
MNIRQIKKTAATFGLVAVITLAGFALSLAHDGSPTASGFSFGLNSNPEKASSLDGHAFQFGLLPKSGPALDPFPKALHRRCSSRHAPSSVSTRQLVLSGAKVKKIALHLLDSVLLI